MIYGKIKHLVKYYGLNDDLDEVLDYIVSGQKLTADSFKDLDKVSLRSKKLNNDSKLVKYYRAKKNHILMYVTNEAFTLETCYTKELEKVLDDEANDSYYYEGDGNVKIHMNAGDFIILFPSDASKITPHTSDLIFEIEVEL